MVFCLCYRSYWVIHISPKYLHVHGEGFRAQLLSNTLMGYEMCDLLIRRLTQLDDNMHANSWCSRWRHFFESALQYNLEAYPCYVLTLVAMISYFYYNYAIAEIPALDITFVREQFIGQEVPYNISACRLVTATPARHLCFKFRVKVSISLTSSF